MPFLDSLDIANRALQHVGVEQILSVGEDTNRYRHTAAAYDKLRRAELERNTWGFAVRKAALRAVDTSTMIIDPSAWDSTVTYLPGAIVKDSNGLLWLSMEPDNLNNSPGVVSAVWERYFGPLTVALYDSTQTYFAGELVYKQTAVQGGYVIYQSLTNANSDVPDTATAWSATVLYNRDDVVTYTASIWKSLIEVNENNTPADGPAAWSNSTSYSSGNTVTGSDHYIYTSVTNGNIGHDPTTDGGTNWTNTNVPTAWSRTPTIPTSSQNWRVIAGQVKNLSFSYPIGSGPLSQVTTNNVYRLPAGYVKLAPQMPKAGSLSPLGSSATLQYTDWEFDGNYIVTSETTPIILRFVADITDVQQMHAMFCEGLAARVATAVCEPLTQSAQKLQNIASAYNRFMEEARKVNAIEQGATEFAEDDWLTCRY